MMRIKEIKLFFKKEEYIQYITLNKETKEKFCKSVACKSDKIQKDVIYWSFTVFLKQIIK